MAAIIDFKTKAKSKALSLFTGSVPTGGPRKITPTALKPLCDYDINDIIKANDPKNLKIIIDKILKKMNLDLNKIGIPQIQEVSLDYYQILNDAEVKEDIKEVKQQILDEGVI